MLGRGPGVQALLDKGESAIDWSNKKARAGLLATIVADADRLLEVALGEGSPERQGIAAAAEQLLLQDVERAGDCLRDGVSRDRMMSVHDPEMATATRAAAGVSTGQGGDRGGHRNPVELRWRCYRATLRTTWGQP